VKSLRRPNANTLYRKRRSGCRRACLRDFRLRDLKREFAVINQVFENGAKVSEK
jgi:hypothetical protein